MTKRLDEDRECFAACAVVIKVLADRRMPDRVADLPAERRMLGWMLCCRARVADFDQVELYDLTLRVHRWIFSVALELLRGRESGALPEELTPSRAVLIQAAELEEVDGAPRELTIERWDAIQRLPGPATRPDLEIALVAALGRKWSVVDETFNVRAG